MLHNSNRVPIFVPESNKYDALKHQNTMKTIAKLVIAILLPLSICAVESAPMLTLASFLLVAVASGFSNNDETEQQ